MTNGPAFANIIERLEAGPGGRGGETERATEERGASRAALERNFQGSEKKSLTKGLGCGNLIELSGRTALTPGKPRMRGRKKLKDLKKVLDKGL